MTLREKSALALDLTLDAATQNRGIYTESARHTLACYCDGQQIRASYIRKLIGYLRLISNYAF